MKTVLETGVDFWLQVSALELDDHLPVTCPECRCASDRRVWEDMNTASKWEISVVKMRLVLNFSV